MSGEPRLPAGWVPRGHSSSMFWVRSRHFTKQADLSLCRPHFLLHEKAMEGLPWWSSG